MKLNLLAGAALAALVVATGAVAGTEGWYGAVDLGYNWKSDYKSASKLNAADGGPYRFDVSTKRDWAGFARLGYRYNDNWRVELEGGYRPGDVDGAHIDWARNSTPTWLCSTAQTATVCGDPTGTIDQTSLFANLIYDIKPEYSFHPFVGVGVGLNSIKANYTGKFNNANVTETVKGKKTVSAFQAIAGLAWALSDQLNLDMTYRYVWNNSVSLNATRAALPNAPVVMPPLAGSYAGKFNDQTVSVGLRWSFAAPVAAPIPVPVEVPVEAPPPPPPPPPVEPAAQYEAREFVVYFPFDQSILTADAQAVVQAAADYSNAGHATKVVVIGHADTSGSAAYNVRLSERRAKVVADALAGLGVPGSVLAVDWKGESAPAVATKDGVKEPLNRRSTIDIGF